MTQFNFDDIKKGRLKIRILEKLITILMVEYEIALQLIQPRKQSGLAQEEAVSCMGTAQSVIARLEPRKQYQV